MLRALYLLYILRESLCRHLHNPEGAAGKRCFGLGADIGQVKDGAVPVLRCAQRASLRRRATTSTRPTASPWTGLARLVDAVARIRPPGFGGRHGRCPPQPDASLGWLPDALPHVLARLRTLPTAFALNALINQLLGALCAPLVHL